MKKLIAVALMVACTSVYAQHHRGHHGGYGVSSNHRPYHTVPHYNPYAGYIAPLIIGGAIGYGLSQSRTVVVEQPVYVERTSPIVTYSAGSSSTQYEEKMLFDSSCNCYRKAYVEK